MNKNEFITVPEATQPESALSIPGQDYFEAFRSMYFLMKGKRDTDIKLYRDNKRFRFSDIVELNDKIRTKLDLHQVVTSNTNVSLSLSSKEIKSFGSWEEFSRIDRNISHSTKCLTLEWDFNILLPNQKHKLPQTHTVRVRIGNGLKPAEMFQVFFLDEGETDFEESNSEMVCKIDFVNNQICNELKMIVSEWYDSLPKNKEEKPFINFVAKNIRLISESIVVLSLLVGVEIIYLFTKLFLGKNNFSSNQDSLNSFLIVGIFSFIVLYICHTVGTFYARAANNKTREKLKLRAMFQITKGDENKLEENYKENRKIIRKLGWDIFIAFFVNMLTLGIGKILLIIF